MKSDKSYLFPFLNVVGKKLYPLLVSRLWLPIVLLVVILLYLPVLFTGFFGDDNWQRLEFSGEAARKLNIDKDIIDKGILNLYAFSGFKAERQQAFLDKGIYPWWLDRDSKINFFRPLSSLTLALDYTLWPDSPLLMHLHSLLWFLLLVVLVFRFYKRIFTRQVIAGLALFLFAIDDVHAGIGWICNRHGVVAMVFGVSSLLFYCRATEKKPFLILSYIFFALSLLASEMGIVSFAFIFTYTFILDKQRIRYKIAALLPFLIIGLIWLAVRDYLGYGVIGSLLYLDPVKSPGLFLLNLPVRFFLLLFSAAGLPVVDLFMMFSPTGSAVIAVIAFVCLGIASAIIGFVFKKSRIAVFWGISLLLSVLPLTTGLPRNTILGFPGLGMMGLAALLLYYISKAERAEFKLSRKIGLKVLIPGLLFCFVVVNPLYILMLPATFRTSMAVQTRLTAFDSTAEIENQCLIIINPPSVATMEAGLMIRLFSDKPLPAYLRYLSSGESPVEILRIDRNTIQVIPQVPFPLFPEGIKDRESGRVFHFHMDILSRWIDSFYYNHNNPPQRGETIKLPEVKITILDVTEDGCIAGVMFRFERALEDPFYKWFRWDKQNQQYSISRMPQPGETIVY